MKIWHLEWSVEHTRPEAPFDATLEPPLKEGEDHWWPIAPNGQPTREPIIFGIIFQELAELDYPYNDQSWPLMRQSMVDALQIRSHLTITAFPVLMIDNELKEVGDPRFKRHDADFAVQYALSKPNLVRDDFFVLRIAPLEGVFDMEASEYQPLGEGKVWMVEEYVFHEPEGGFPPVFRIAEQPTKLFITQEARERLKKAGIRGPVYRIPGGPPAKDEVDVPVLL